MYEDYCLNMFLELSILIWRSYVPLKKKITVGINGCKGQSWGIQDFVPAVPSSVTSYLCPFCILECPLRFHYIDWNKWRTPEEGAGAPEGLGRALGGQAALAACLLPGGGVRQQSPGGREDRGPPTPRQQGLCTSLQLWAGTTPCLPCTLHSPQAFPGSLHTCKFHVDFAGLFKLPRYRKARPRLGLRDMTPHGCAASLAAAGAEGWEGSSQAGLRPHPHGSRSVPDLGTFWHGHDGFPP